MKKALYSASQIILGLTGIFVIYICIFPADLPDFSRLFVTAVLIIWGLSPLVIFAFFNKTCQNSKQKVIVIFIGSLILFSITGYLYIYEYCIRIKGPKELNLVTFPFFQLLFISIVIFICRILCKEKSINRQKHN